ncbi:MAG: hypothetical protein SGPRY_010824, partial [Prymnesium sp.]
CQLCEHAPSAPKQQAVSTFDTLAPRLHNLLNFSFNESMPSEEKGSGEEADGIEADNEASSGLTQDIPSWGGPDSASISANLTILRTPADGWTNAACSDKHSTPPPESASSTSLINLVVSRSRTTELEPRAISTALAITQISVIIAIIRLASKRQIRRQSIAAATHGTEQSFHIATTIHSTEHSIDAAFTIPYIELFFDVACTIFYSEHEADALIRTSAAVSSLVPRFSIAIGKYT